MANTPEYMKAYYEKNKEEIKKKAKIYREQSKEKIAVQQKAWATANPEKAAAKSARYRKKRRVSWWDEYKGKLCCEKCGDNRFYCLDFHHKDQSTKSFNVGQCTYSKTKEQLLAEIEKCLILCANCHRELHYLEKQSQL